MLFHFVDDWTNAYSVIPHVPGGTQYPQRWVDQAAGFREGLFANRRARLDLAYGRHPRQVMDIFFPEHAPRGLLVFFHGGFWKSFDKSSWSHLADGALKRGLTVVIPSYRLCPDVEIGDIVNDAAAAIEWAAGQVQGPIYLAGHSAGGHLVTRVLCEPSPLEKVVHDRIRRCLSISGLHDLRPLIKADMNAILRLDEAEAKAHSPALLRPKPNTEIIAWVGAAERAEFLRQNRLLPAMWGGFALKISECVEPDRHHFDVVDGLIDEKRGMLDALLGSL